MIVIVSTRFERDDTDTYTAPSRSFNDFTTDTKQVKSFFPDSPTVYVDLPVKMPYTYIMNRSALAPRRRWEKENPDKTLVTDLYQGLKKTHRLDISPITCELLVNRGLTDVDEVYNFIYPELSSIPDPFLMADMDKAVDRIIPAVAARKKIWVYGDYDVDGITSVAVLLLFLSALGIEARYYIPDRIKEGYSLNPDAVRFIHAQGADLIITVDSGISNHDEIRLAKELGMEVIVSDHHEVGDTLPPADAVLNPKRSDCAFPFKDLAGVGITFNLVIAIRKRLKEQGGFDNLPNLKRYLDLVALGTVADIVPLKGENRIFVKYGLMELREDTRPGIVALRDTSGVKRTNVDSTAVSFRLAPRLNASGRIGNADQSVRLLITDDPAEALSLARDLESENQRRQRMEEEVLRHALVMLDSNGMIQNRHSIVLAHETWHPGVVGIVASRLVDRYCRPVILLSLRDGFAKGSARSITGFHLYEGLSTLDDMILGFGGHKYAAGLTIRADTIQAFAENFDRVVTSMTTEEDFVPTITIDTEITLADIKRHNLLHETKLLAPFGGGNPEPVFLCKGLVPGESRIVGDNHLKLVFKEKNIRYNAIGFGLGGLSHVAADMVDTVFSVRESQWDRGGMCELLIRDLKVP
jgi:single-stranded-DNA-specific exonuclease